MSSALAHHYFGSKERIFLAAMRHILAQYGTAAREALHGVTTPRARLFAVIHASFGGTNFEQETAAAWLNFYALALIDPEAARLLRVYHSRLRSNLLVCLRPLIGEGAVPAAQTLGALIDGLYLRGVLSGEIDGPAADIRIRGDTDLRAQRFDQARLVLQCY